MINGLFMRLELKHSVENQRVNIIYIKEGYSFVNNVYKIYAKSSN